MCWKKWILTIISCLMSVLSIMFALVSKDVIDAATHVNNKIFSEEVIKLVIFVSSIALIKLSSSTSAAANLE